MARPAPWWLLLVLAAFLGGIAALAFDRGFAVLRQAQSPSATPTLPLPTREPPVVVALPTTNPTAVPTAAPGDVAADVMVLRGALSQHGGLLLVARAERHTALAAEAFAVNDIVVADRQLVAARAALDSAFGLLGEDLKQVIDGQQREVSSMRSELQVNPEGMDQRLRATQDLLLGLIVPSPQ